MRATKLVLTVKHLTCKERLRRLKLPTLKYRRIRGDMTEVVKILTDCHGRSFNLRHGKRASWRAWRGRL